MSIGLSGLFNLFLAKDEGPVSQVLEVKLTMNNRGLFSKASMLVGAVLLTASSSLFANLLFEDDFSSGDMSKYNASFRWGIGNTPTKGQSASQIVKVAGPSGATVSAVKFEYAALSSAASESQKYWAEERFHLTASATEVRSQNGASSVAYPEVWLSYWLYVPSNYAHGPVNPSNNKGFVTLWKNEYMGQVGSAIDWWRTGSNQSRIGAWVGEDGNGANHGNKDTPTFIRADHRIGDGGALSILPSEHGKWVHVAVGMKISPNSTARSGFISVYKNGEKVISWEGLNNWNTNPALQGYDRGYLLGWANSGYSTQTTFYLTGFKFATSLAGAIGNVSAPAVGAPPSAPSLRIN